MGNQNGKNTYGRENCECDHSKPCRVTVYLTEQNSAPSQPGQAGAKIEVTPEMIEAGRAALDQWMRRWDWLEDGAPEDEEINRLLISIYSDMTGKSCFS